MTSRYIIDDVDVSECEFYMYSGNHGELTHYCTYQKDEDGLDTRCNADFNKNCFYKEILRRSKRKEEECERLKIELGYKEQELENIEETVKPYMERPNDLDYYNLEWIVKGFAQQLDQLKAENDELKKTINDLLNKPEIQDKILWKIDNKALLGSKDAWIYKLEHALQEIKELTEKNYCEEGVCGFQSRRKHSYCGNCIHKLILQKCEVLNDK